MNVEVHIDWQGTTGLAGRLYPAGRGSGVTFEYDRAWLARPDAFAFDPTALPLQRNAHLRLPFLAHCRIVDRTAGDVV